MAMRIPSNVREFLERFADWPNDSQEQRGDIEAGSRWTIRDIGTFQILRLEMRRDFPRWLQDRYEEARERVMASTESQRAIQLLRTNWRGLSQTALIEASSSFGAFFSLLAKVIEQPPTPMPDRYLRSDIHKGQFHSPVKNPHFPGKLLYLPRLLNLHQSGCEVNAILIGVIAITHPTTRSL
ncbi:hypothetical protein B7494_g6717 [Chlorociboria aeruginascens]|nr:hypothetical protein B7494_g6717 [Chlorociboria aeruginascens]